MARARVKLNIQGLREVLKSEGMQAVLESHGQRTAAAARASAPYDPEDDGVHYRDSITVETRVHRHVAATRVRVEVPYALKVEARTGNLARALQ